MDCGSGLLGKVRLLEDVLDRLGIRTNALEHQNTYLDSMTCFS